MRKKKVFRTLTTLALAAVCAFSFLLAGCKNKADNDDDNKGGEDVKYTQTSLIENGSTDYKIVVNETDGTMSNYAASEINYFFSLASGLEFEKVTDEDLTYDANAKYLSIGDTALATAAGVTYDSAELGDSGYVVKTVGNTVFMLGGRFGVIYAAYEFMRQEIDFRVYSDDEIRYNTGVRNVKLVDTDVKDIPDFEYRMATNGQVIYDVDYTRRMRMNHTHDVWIPLGETAASSYHNFFNIIPKSKWQKTKPEWYSPNGKQLCLSRDVEGLKAAVLEVMKKCIIANPNGRALTFTQMDVNTWCDCDTCAASKETYGTDAAIYIKFVNSLAKDLKKWLDEEQGGRKIDICIFAYHRTEDAPVKEVSPGVYEPIDESVKAADNVQVLYAPINADYHRDYYDSTNKQYLDTMRKWSVICNKMYLWMYSLSAKNHLVPFDSFSSQLGDYRAAKENGVCYVFDQGQFNQARSTDWTTFKIFLQSRLQWNTEADVVALTDEFFDNYFRDGSAAMRKFYEDLRVHEAYLSYVVGKKGEIVGEDTKKKSYWPEGKLREWMTCVDEAYAAIEPLKTTDPDGYAKAERHITLESISPRYILLDLYSTSYSPSELQAEREKFRNDASRLGMTRMSEFDELSALWEKWGLE